MNFYRVFIRWDVIFPKYSKIEILLENTILEYSPVNACRLF